MSIPCCSLYKRAGFAENPGDIELAGGTGSFSAAAPSRVGAVQESNLKEYPMPSIKFVPTADASVVSARSREILQALLSEAGLASCVVTSTVRSPTSQARAMFNNIEATSIARQRALYSDFGDQVIDEYQRLKPQGHGRQVILDAMEARINSVGPGNVSRHCADPALLNVIDIAPSSIADPQAFLDALGRAKQAGAVSRFFSPANGDPAFHVEIPQRA